MANVVEFTETGWDEEVLKAEGPVLVDFTADWCGPCKKLAPIVAELSQQYDGKVKVGKLDVGAHASIASRYGVLSIPTVIIFKGGEIRQKFVGLPARDKLIESIDSLT